MTVQFKGQELTQKKCINNIIRFYSLATASELKEGFEWYTNAKQYCTELAARFNVTVSQVAGIIAAFSPQTGWTENKRFVLSFLIAPKQWIKNDVQYAKAKAILKLKNEADIYQALSVNGTAWKTKAFFLNILNPDIITEVTIDRHAIASCIQKPDKVEALSDAYSKLTVNQYRFLESCYGQAAIQLGILPQDLQAIVWTVYRRLRDLKQHEDSKGWEPFESDITF